MTKVAVKRAFDIIASMAGIILTGPLIILLALIIRRRLGKPVFFQQTRPGLQGYPFNILKFRTMNKKTDDNGKLLPDEDRLTRLGHLLRTTSLDELPELFNVLKGDMSMVGPRPLLMQYLNRYTPEQARRHEVKPGITGWAQINGRNAISWEEKFKLDVWYVDNHSFWLDIKILFRTAYDVITRRGINADNHPTMPEFKNKEES